jgi:hypothetical protein
LTGTTSRCATSRRSAARSSEQSWAIIVSTGALNAHMAGTPK